MRFLQWLVVFAVLLSSARAAEVPVRTHCHSLRFQSAVAETLFEEYRFELTTTDEFANGELALEFSPIATHYSYGVLHLPDFAGTVVSLMFADIPDFTDSNRNGVHDFYEVSQAVAGTLTAGYIEDLGLGEETIFLTWNRAAGSHYGTCTLEIVDLGLVFEHTFEIYEYAGTYTYAKGTEVDWAGSLALTRVGDTSFTFAANAEFEVFGGSNVELLSGIGTNEAGATLEHLGAILTRTGSRYQGEFIFWDGDLSTAAEDFDFWLLYITDTNDQDGDGIPNFSDPPTISVVAPTLSLRPVGNALELTVAGGVGNTVTVQHTDSLSAPNWTTFTNLTLTLSTQAVTVPKPAGGQRFWRAQVP